MNNLIRPKIQGLGLPFEVHCSSCADRKPLNFDWSVEEQEIKVCIDRAIVTERNYGGTDKFGWLCESRAILHDLIPYLTQNLDHILPCYRKIFTCQRELLALNSKFEFCFSGSNLPWIPAESRRIFPKTKLCSMIASPKVMCAGHVLRHKWAAALKDKLDLFGGAAGSLRLGKDPRNPWHSKLPGLQEYMFSVVFENDRYSTYFTEKITDCFATGTIPVYWGAPDIAEYFNPDGIIPLDENFLGKLSPELYQSKHAAIEDNFYRAQRLCSADDMLFEKIQICFQK